MLRRKKTTTNDGLVSRDRITYGVNQVVHTVSRSALPRIPQWQRLNYLLQYNANPSRLGDKLIRPCLEN